MTEPDQQGRETLFINQAQLVVRWPGGREQAFPLYLESTRIGRGEEGNQIAIPANITSISRQHLEIRRQGAIYYASDLGSRYGVLLNGSRLLRPTALQEGDELRIGSAESDQEIRIVFRTGTGTLVEGSVARISDSPIETRQMLSAPPTDSPFFKIRWPDGRISYFPIQKDETLVGRIGNADLHIPETLLFVSQNHFLVQRERSGYTIRDLKSTNGTFLNNQRLEPQVPVALRHDMVVRIGDDAFGVSIGFTFENPTEAGVNSTLLVEGFAPVSGTTVLEKIGQVTIGRSPECAIQLDAPDVSRRHARVNQLGDVFWIEDLGSINGTYLNGQLIRRKELQDGDLIQIGKFVLVFENGELTQYQSTGMRLDVSDLSKDVRSRGHKLRILEDINFSILPREFVALVGGSGAGKTTLLNALIGFRPGDGQVLLNGQDFYQEYEHYRSQLGYVPQNDILHTSLTVEKALDYATRLRLPGNLSEEERRQRITTVLETVSMNTETIRKTRISDLSGGQRKRVSIAAELLADPKLIYLDEATSGLDPGLEKKLMHTLRRMADEGRTIVLITHATSNILQTDHVAFLSQGRLVYFGPSQEALEFFGVEDFADIYELIEKNGEKWQRTYQDEKPEQYQRYVLRRQKTSRQTTSQALPRSRFGLGDFFRQLLVLTQRTFNVLASDPITLGLMLLLFPVTAILQLVISSPEILTGNLAILADPVAAASTMLSSYVPYPGTNTFVFVMGLEAVLVGLYVPPNELIRERAIFLRERMVNLKVLPYLLSKVLIYTIFVTIQVVLYLLIVSLGVDFPERGLYLPGYLELFITLFLTMMAGIGIGMIVAAVSRSTDMAIYLLVMLLFFQFFFAGTVFDLRGNRAEPLSYLTATRWSLNALGVTIDMQKLAESTILCNEVPTNPLDPASETQTVCFNYPEAREDLLLPYEDAKLAQSWLILIVMTVISLAVTGILLKRMDPAS